MTKTHRSYALGVFALSFLAANALTASSPQDWWENPDVVAVNKEDAHATYVPYSSTADLKADAAHLARPWETSKSSQRILLNGNDWKFNYVSSPELRPNDFFEANYDSSEWDIISVPSCWQMLGYDTPMYINVDYPFDQNKIPQIVARADNDGYDPNPVGSYLKTFSIPAAWNGQEIFLNFEGIYSAAYVWINGRFVGYSQAANTNHEFDITEYIRTGSNTLAVQVLKWSDGSWIEDQDMFRWGGIFRDVTLTAVPKTFIRDHYITWTPAEGTYTDGQITVNVDIDNRSDKSQAAKVDITILNPDGTTLTTLPSIDTPAVDAGHTVGGTTSAQLSGLNLWSCEDPALYTIVFSLKDAQGNETEAFATKYGFRHIEQVGTFVHINGQKVFFKGVDRQDTHPITGRTMDTESQLKDVLLFKQYNINCVRTSHCPHQEKMMAMYDHFGIYVMDEADLEAHALQGKITSDPAWAKAFVDRQERMVLRDRNHPSVIFWSLGNETKNGSNFTACYNAVKELDSRMIHYEGQQASGFPNSDMTSKMYPYEGELWSMDGWNDSRPHFLCEYAHSMGQSLGNFVDYWDFIENSKRTIGGCIWDWADQAIYDPKEIKAGTYKPGRWYTGYDYPGPHQGNFMSNGVVDPERNISAKLIEVKKVHQWVKFISLDPATQSLRLLNKYNFTNLDKYQAIWSLSRDGEEVQTGNIDGISLAPGDEGTFDVNYTAPADDDLAEYLLTVRFITKEDTDWADAGHVVAEEQFTVQARQPLAAVDTQSFGKSLVTTGNGPIKVAGEGFSYTINSNGELTSINVGGIEFIHNSNGLKFDDVRWIENDSPYRGTPPSSFATYQVPSQGLVVKYTDGDANGAKAVKVITSNTLSGIVDYTVTYTIYADGILDVTPSYNARTSLSRLGMSLQLNPMLENIEYFARGPLDNYSDRKTGSFAAIYRTTVSDMADHFVKPQSTGYREELRYAKLTSPEDPGFGLLIETEGQCSFSALHFTEEDLGSTYHDWELTPREEIVLHLDYQQKGIGNGSCGSTVWGQYLIPTGKELSHTLRFTPLAGNGNGYAVPQGTPGAHITSLKADGNAVIDNAKAPEDLYCFIPTDVIAKVGQPLTLDIQTSATVAATAWLDLNHSLTFDSDEAAAVANGKAQINIPANTKPGQYRLRIALDTTSPKANGPIASGRVYDLPIDIKAFNGTTPAEYVTPNGSLHDMRKAYVKSITTTGAATNISYTAERCPKFYTLLDETVEATAGSFFTLSLKANEAGPRSTDKAYQDLRYNRCYIFADLDNSGSFTPVATYGNKMSGQNILANYDHVMDINHNFFIPENASEGIARIRIIYQNAWRGLDSPEQQDILEGVAYDITLNILPQTHDNKPCTAPTTFFDTPDGTMHPDGNAWLKRISSTGATGNIDARWTESPDQFYTLLDQTIETEAGQEFNIRFSANSLGKKGEEIRQDLRFNHATIFADWDGMGIFKRVERIGEIMKDSAPLGNYDKVMTITQKFKTPLTDSSRGTIRIIYQNAWKPEPTAADKNIVEGIAYDIPINIKQESAVIELSAPAAPTGIYDLQGRRLDKASRPGIYIIDGKKVKK